MINFDLLVEELKDIDKFPHNVHYTNENNLVSILRDGYLKGSIYSFTLKKSSEISTLRRSEDRRIKALKKKDPEKYEEKMEELSENIGSVKIYLFTDRIKSGARGIKKYPIAEYNIADRKFINEHFKVLFEKYQIYQNNKGVELKDFQKDLEGFINNILKNKKGKIETKKTFMYSNEDPDMIKIKKYLKDKYKVEEEIVEKVIYFLHSIFNSLVKLKNLHSQRESEERFHYNDDKIKGIPVKKEFMKIRFLKFYSLETSTYEKLYPYMIKKPGLFVKDKNFDRIIKDVKRKKEMDKWLEGNK